MSYVTYTALRQLTSGHTAGATYDLDILGTSNRRLAVDKTIIKSEEGQTITLFNREEIIYRIQTKVFGVSVVDQIENIQEFLHSVARGESFTYYPISEIGDITNPLNVILDGTRWNENRVGIRNNFRYNFELRVLP